MLTKKKHNKEELIIPLVYRVVCIWLYYSGQIMIFHQPRFLPYPGFPLSEIIQQLSNCLCLPFPILLVILLRCLDSNDNMFGHGMPFWNHEMRWVEVATAPIVFFNMEVVLQHFAFTVSRYAHIFTSVSICVIKIHLVSYSCLEKGKFTLPKKVMLKQNKGHLSGFPHPNPSKWLPVQSFFSRFKSMGVDCKIERKISQHPL